MAIDEERLRRIRENTTPEDVAAIRGDWQAVGNDLREAILRTAFNDFANDKITISDLADIRERFDPDYPSLIA